MLKGDMRFLTSQLISFESFSNVYAFKTITIGTSLYTSLYTSHADMSYSSNSIFHALDTVTIHRYSSCNIIYPDIGQVGTGGLRNMS